MTLSIIVALKKKFFFIRLSLWGAFSPKYIDTYLNCIFTIQGVPKMKNAKKWAKVEINDFN